MIEIVNTNLYWLGFFQFDRHPLQWLVLTFDTDMMLRACIMIYIVRNSHLYQRL